MVVKESNLRVGDLVEWGDEPNIKTGKVHSFKGELTQIVPDVPNPRHPGNIYVLTYKLRLVERPSAVPLALPVEDIRYLIGFVTAQDIFRMHKDRTDRVSAYLDAYESKKQDAP